MSAIIQIQQPIYNNGNNQYRIAKIQIQIYYKISNSPKITLKYITYITFKSITKISYNIIIYYPGDGVSEDEG